MLEELILLFDFLGKFGAFFSSEIALICATDPVPKLVII
jgi:hypothetical protein